MPNSFKTPLLVSLLILILALVLRHYEYYSMIDLHSVAENIPYIGGLFACSHHHHHHHHHHDQEGLNDADTKEGLETNRDRLLTANELTEYSGTKGLYLSILGHIYNVEKGEKHYGHGKAYHHFTGRDASRSFVTGDFSEEGLRDDVLDLSHEDLLGILKWKDTYDKTYEYVGKLIGRFFDENGERTEYGVKVEKAFEEAERQKLAQLEEQKRLPPCNTEWIYEVGGRVWCTNQSGGIERNWVGVPRQLFSVDSKKPKCVCVHPSSLNNPALKVYDNCDSDSDSCKID